MPGGSQEMLVVTRKDREAVKIGDDILVVVWRTDDGRIRVGIDAPRSIPIHRVSRDEARAHTPSASEAAK